MYPKKAILLAALFVAAESIYANGSSNPASLMANVIEASPLSENATEDGLPRVIGGEVADPKQYPAIFQATVAGRICTWFLIGPKVLLGAAHCIVGANANQPMIRVRIRMPGHPAPFETQDCAVAIAYPVDASQDWAACRFAAAVPVPQGVGIAGYEVLESSPLPRNAVVEIGGFGCTTPGGAVSSVYVFGTARVMQVPPNVLLPRAVLDTPNAVELAQEPALLCEGDSGGPAYLYPDRDDRVHRRVVGVNSQTLIEAQTSYLASITTETAKEFLINWAGKRGLQICGLDASTPNCRP